MALRGHPVVAVASSQKVDGTASRGGGFPERPLAGEIYESVRKRLHGVRDVLESDYDHPVCLLSFFYYQRYESLPAKKTVQFVIGSLRITQSGGGVTMRQHIAIVVSCPTRIAPPERARIRARRAQAKLCWL